MVKTKKQFSVDDLCSMFIDFYDEINPYNVMDDNFKHTDKYALDFCAKVYDTIYIWAGVFKSQEEMEKAYENTTGVCSTWVNYNPIDKTVEIEIADHNEEYYYIDIEGDGVEKIIYYLEQYCVEQTGMSGEEIIKDFITDKF